VSRDYAAYRRLLRGRRLPAAFVDLEMFDANAAALVRRANGTRVRIATKSVRCVPLLRRVLEAQPLCRGLLCYSGWEAAWLGGQGFDDLLVAYPLWQDEELRAVAGRVAAGAVVTVMADSAAHVERLAAAASAAGIVLPVCIDVDLSSDYPGLHFGVWRSPVRTAAAARALAREIAGRPELRLDGVMGYEAQVAGLQDRGRPRLRQMAVRALKRLSVRAAAGRRAEVVAALQADGHRLRFVNGGGTGSVETTRAEACVTEIAAGSALFAPALFDGYDRFRHLPAAAFAIEITRRPRKDVFTCLGGGYVASGAAGRDRLPVPWLPAGARLLPAEGAGEVQTPVLYRGPERLELGDPVLFRHAKAGELCEHFPALLLIQGDAVVGEAATYRGEGQHFL
jgi:D-serine deaminase-like pyridoxal phosphate-dependent protein